MLSLASLLNPIQSEPGSPLLPSSPTTLQGTSSPTPECSQPLTPVTVRKQKMIKDAAVFAKDKVRGEINYPPFEDSDEETRREVQKFQVYPLGEIEKYCRHIPYNSEKKNFQEKTGRESFEVFQYTFKVPGNDKEYCVMWDYNIGLVRITPFFKCCNYSKTTPAKMIKMNPGLREITHSITGGALAAQGYWMPFNCALEICTTFCADIAGALIPIFGPNFPSLCVPPEAPEHGRMTISPDIIHAATIQAEAYRLRYSNINTPSVTPSSKSSYHEDSVSQEIDAGFPTFQDYGANRSGSGLGNGGSTQMNKRRKLKRVNGDCRKLDNCNQNFHDTETSDIEMNDSDESGLFRSTSSQSTPTRIRLPRPRTGLAHRRTAISKLSGLRGNGRFKTTNPLLSAVQRRSDKDDTDVEMTLLESETCNGKEIGNEFTPINTRKLLPSSALTPRTPNKRRFMDVSTETEANTNIPPVAEAEAEDVSSQNKNDDVAVGEVDGSGGIARVEMEAGAALLLLSLGVNDGGSRLDSPIAPSTCACTCSSACGSGSGSGSGSSSGSGSGGIGGHSFFGRVEGEKSLRSSTADEEGRNTKRRRARSL